MLNRPFSPQRHLLFSAMSMSMFGGSLQLQDDCDKRSWHTAAMDSAFVRLCEGVHLGEDTRVRQRAHMRKGTRVREDVRAREGVCVPWGALERESAPCIISAVFAALEGRERERSKELLGSREASQRPLKVAQPNQSADIGEGV
eukprot:5602209-Pleurochrysis_carterae.AAC.2